MNSSSEESIGLNTIPSTMLPPSTYVSCIKIDGRPILPPLMTEAKRTEMQRYKELAIALESKLKQRKQLATVPLPHEKREAAAVDQEMKDLHKIEIPSEPQKDFEPSAVVIENVLQPQAGFEDHFVIRRPLNIPTPTETENQAEVPSGEDDENKENENIGKNEGSCSSSDDFASVDSSIATFITKEGPGAGNEKGSSKSLQSLDNDDNEKGVGGGRSEGEASLTLSPDKENRSPGEKSGEREDLILSCKRKRPAFYFDEADDDDDGNESESEAEEVESEAINAETTYETTCSEPSKGTSSSISLNPFLPPDVTWSSVSAASTSFPGTEANNSMPRDIFYVDPQLSPSLRTPEHSQSFEHENSDTVKQNRQRQQPLNSSYEVTLSTKIPSSAENTPIKRPDESGKLVSNEENPESDSSDKENHDTSKSSASHSSSHKKHVRKLSYTLEQPSDALLASGMKASDTQAQDADAHAQEFDVMTFPLSTIIRTPIKFSDIPSKILAMPTPTAEELDNKLEALDRHLQQLQVGVELNKKKHLERYMEDVADCTNSTSWQPQSQRQSAGSSSIEFSPQIVNKSTPIKDFQKEIEEKFNELQQQQQKQLEQLMKVHQEQENKLKEDFDRQRAFFLEQLRGISTSTNNIANLIPAPPSLPKSLPTTPRNFRKEDVSVKSFTSLRNSTNPFVTSTATARTPPDVSAAQGQPASSGPPPIVFSDPDPDPRSGLSSATAQSNYPASDWTTATDFEADIKSVMSTSTANTLTELCSVGLSKLQAKMRALSPQYRKMGGEAKSPLLKGVAFPNPLNRSHAPVRVPPKALEPEMAPKFARISACVRGYLTRRLLHTDKIQTIIQTIRDTVDFVMRLYEENPNDPTRLQIRPEDMNLHRMLIQQLNGACSSFHGIFFKLTTTERIAIIATDRQKLKAKAMKEHLSQHSTSSNDQSKYKRNVSAATMKAIERRLSFVPKPNTQQQVPKTPVYHPPRKMPSQSQSQVAAMGSKSVNPKPIAKFKLGVGISPSPSTKRRRLSHYVFKPPRNVSAAVDTGLTKSSKRLSRASSQSNANVNVATPKFIRPASVTDQNGNNWKPRASCAATAGIGPSVHQHNVTYTMQGAVAGAGEAGFQANPGRIETNFSGADTICQDIFNNLLTSGPAPVQLGLPRRPASQPQASAAATNTSGSTSASASLSASSSRFSIGSNHSRYHYSSTSTRASATASRGAGASRKSVSRNTKPWK